MRVAVNSVHIDVYISEITVSVKVKLIGTMKHIIKALTIFLHILRYWFWTGLSHARGHIWCSQIRCPDWHENRQAKAVRLSFSIYRMAFEIILFLKLAFQYILASQQWIMGGNDTKCTFISLITFHLELNCFSFPVSFFFYRTRYQIKYSKFSAVI